MTIALAMIVRDEEPRLAAALDSARALVDEIVVVDTGSVDDTIAVARAGGARVEHFTWVDDFAAARNHALHHLDADHVLILDADERCRADHPDVLRAWSADAPPGTAGIVTVESITESDGAQMMTTTTSIRMLPRAGRYVGRVHEMPSGHTHTSPVPGLVIGHDGYLPATVARKRGRNERLLRAVLAEQPDDPYLLFQLGRERQIAGDHAGAARLYEQVLPHLTDRMPWRDEAVVRALFTLQRSDRTDEALTLAGRQLTGNLSAEVLFACGNLFLDTAITRAHQWRQYIDLARHAWETCLRIGEPTDGRDHTPGCGTFLAAENLAALSDAQGDQDAAHAWRLEAIRLRTQ